MSFLPQDYALPSESSYMSLEDGKNKFRVLSSAVVGMMYWKTTGDTRKPIRKRMGEPIPSTELEMNRWGKVDKPKHFWAFVVYNYNDKKVQILEITQKGVMKSIETLVSDEDWGDPKDYDITITRSGKDLDTEYNVTPSPKKPVDSEIVADYERMTIHLDALFVGADPFNYTPELTEQDLEEFQKGL
jgi:hypothetical protein